MSLTVGQVLKSEKDGTVTHRIVFKNIPGSDAVKFPIVINEGDTLFLNKPSDRLNYLLKQGKISQDQYDQLLNDYETGNKSFVRFEVKGPVSK